MWTLNESFALGTADVACAEYAYCGLFNIETNDVLFFGSCKPWFVCICYGYIIENGQPVGDILGYETDFCDM